MSLICRSWSHSIFLSRHPTIKIYICHRYRNPSRASCVSCRTINRYRLPIVLLYGWLFAYRLPPARTRSHSTCIRDSGKAAHNLKTMLDQIQPIRKRTATYGCSCEIGDAYINCVISLRIKVLAAMRLCRSTLTLRDNGTQNLPNRHELRRSVNGPKFAIGLKF